MKLTVDIIEDFIKTLDLSGVIVSFSDDGTNTTLIVDKTFHARKGMVATIDDVRYEIISVSYNQSITIAGVLPGLLTFNVFVLDNPFYFHGTPIMTNNHISQASENEKTPMVYLYEILKEKDNPPNDRIRREADTRFFFLDSADFNDWSTDEHYSNRLKGLNALVDVFIEAAKKNKQFYTFETQFNRTNHVNWGVFINDKGHTKRLFSDNLTGVELSFNLKVYDDCKTGVKPPSRVCAPATAIVQDQDGNELARENIPSGATGIIAVNVGGGVLYTYPYDSFNTGQDVSYATGDDKWVRDNVFAPEIASWPIDRPWVFPVLDPNNPLLLLRGATPEGTNIFGNLERFTDTLGGQDYDNDLVIDHYMGLMHENDYIGIFLNFYDSLAYVNSYTNVYGDFFVPNKRMIESIVINNFPSISYFPFKMNVFSPDSNSNINNIHTSTVDSGGNFNFIFVPVDVNRKWILSRGLNNSNNTIATRKAFTYDPNQDTTKLILT